MTDALRAALSLRLRLLSAVLICACAAVAGMSEPARSEVLTNVNQVVPPKPKKPKENPFYAPGQEKISMNKRDPNARMLMEAKELIYDYDKEVVTAVGKVDIYYDGRTLQADRVAYDQKANRVKAYGNVKMTERNGNVAYGDTMDVTDDFRDGFITPLKLDTANNTHFAAAKARRENGTVSIFDRGVYTACEPCRDNPDKPPLWQIKAKRIIWREDEKMIYYDDATFELWGQPIAWLPYFSSVDPSVKRKTGLLAPKFMKSSRVGYGIETPYYWVLSPTSDLTLAPLTTTKQGVMLKGEYRQNLINGSYSIRAAGISQLNSDEFRNKVPATINGKKLDDAGLTIGSGNKKNRWAFSTEGEFAINEKWKIGWDVNLLSDKWVRGNYNLWGDGIDATSTLYLTGQGDRSWFEVRGYKFYGLSRYDQQDRLPWVAPVIDYNYTFEDPVAGGELSYNINSTTTYRSDNDFARWRDRRQPRFDNALVGAAGTYSRLSGDIEWRRQFIDPIGQVWTPFAFMRGDLIYTKPDNGAGVGPFMNHDQDFLLRGMAGVGLEYRFPFIATSSIGTHQIEPIIQVIARPNENQVGKLPNEDAQSLIYDDTNLFSWNKFSGYDRIEGGSRANVGAQYTLSTLSGATFSVIAGQSYQLAGKNSFKALDPTRTGNNTGLDEDTADYVGGLTFAPNEHLSFAGHLRLDDKNFNVRYAELESRATFERFQANVAYARVDEQPLQGYTEMREGVIAGARVYVTKDVYVEGGARYNIDQKVFDRTQLGAGVDDISQCLSLGFSYIRQIASDSYTLALNRIDNRFLLRVDFRTLGSTQVSTHSKSGSTSDSLGN